MAAASSRFYCAGADRIDERTGRRACNYRSAHRWPDFCPRCHRPYACRPIRNAVDDRMRMNLGDALRIPPLEHHASGIHELDLVLGGGLVYGKVVLFGGVPGAGKSRLLLQLADAFARPERRVCFASGEDSLESVAQFAQQLGCKNQYVEICGNPNGLNPAELTESLKGQRVKLLIVDSLQTCGFQDLKGALGGDAQIAATTNHLSEFAKSRRVAVIVISQLTKGADYRASGNALHGVDVLARFDPVGPLCDGDGDPIPGTEDVCQLWIDGKSRQGSTKVTAYLNMVNGRLEPLSRELHWKVAKLKLVPP